MKRKLLLVFLMTSPIAFSQVGVGTTTPRAALEVNSATNGFLAPQIALSVTTASAPVVNPAGGALLAGTIVYNTATVNDVTPGYYYWSGTAWIRMAAGAAAATPHNTLDMAYDEGGAGAGRIINADAGAVTINNTNAGTSGLLINNNSTASGIAGQRTNVINNNTIGIVANVTADGVGMMIDHNDTNNVYSGLQVTNYSTIGSGILSTTNSAGTAISAEASATSNAANAMTIRNFRTAAGAGLDVIGAIGTRSTSQTAAGSAFAGYLNATQGTAAQFNGAGLGALTATNVFAGNNRYGIIAQGNPVGIYSNYPSASGAAFVGYAGNYAIWTGFALVTGGTYYDYYKTATPKAEHKMMLNVVGPGINATTIEKDDKIIVMPAVSAPENLFQDYGTGKLVNGRAKIVINPILTENIVVDKEHPLKVFVQLEGDCNGVYVTNKSASGFEVVELGNGTSNIEFSYSIVASRASKNVTAKNGSVHKFNMPERFMTIDSKASTLELLQQDNAPRQESQKIESQK